MQMYDYRSYSMILGVAVSRRVVYGIISKTGSGMRDILTSSWRLDSNKSIYHSFELPRELEDTLLPTLRTYHVWTL